MMDQQKIKITQDLIKAAKDMAKGHRKNLASFLSRLDGLSKNSQLVLNQRVNAVANKIAILQADNCGNCPGLPSPQAQQMAINTARRIAASWAKRATEAINELESGTANPELITKYSSNAS